jgi:hypothetical protein
MSEALEMLRSLRRAEVRGMNGGARVSARLTLQCLRYLMMAILSDVGKPHMHAVEGKGQRSKMRL